MRLTIFVTFITILIFGQFFFKGLAPFPGNYLVAWFEPWKSETLVNNAPGIVHKAVVDDAIRELYPFRVLAWDLLKRREWPSWNPYNGAGQPLLAVMHPGFLNPLGLISLVAPPQISWSLLVIAQILFLGIGMYLYGRVIGLSPLAAFFSLATMAFSGFVIARLEYAEYVYGLSSMPLLLYIYEKFRKDKQSRVIFILPAVVFFLFISSHPQAIFYVMLTAAIYWFWREHFCAERRSPRQTMLILGLALVGLGLSAIQLLPTVELYRLANVTTSSSTFIFEKFLLSASSLVTILIPNYFGNQGTYNFWGQADYVETAASIGLIPLFLAIVALETKSELQKSLSRLFIIIAFGSVLLSIRWFLPKFLYQLPIPILSTGVPTRIFMLTTFALSVLAGIGFDEWFRANKLTKLVQVLLKIFLTFVAGVVLVTGLLFVSRISCPTVEIPQCRSIALRNTILEVSVFAVAAALLVMHRVKRIRAVPWVIIGAVVAIGWYNSMKFLPFSPKETFYPPNELITTIKKMAGFNRVFGLGSANIKTDLATMLRIFDPQYYDPLYLRRFGELVSWANTGLINVPLARSDIEIIHDLNVGPEVTKRRERLLDLLSVRYVIYKKSELTPTHLGGEAFLPTSAVERRWENAIWQIEERKTALPRAYLVSNYELISDPKFWLPRLFADSFDPYKAVILEKDPNIPREQSSQAKEAISLESYQEHRLSLRVNTQEPRLLVLTDNYYPGWKALVDGRPTPVYRANYTFRAMVVPPGEHNITFIYDPASLKLGLGITAVSLIFYLFLLARQFKAF